MSNDCPIRGSYSTKSKMILPYGLIQKATVEKQERLLATAVFAIIQIERQSRSKKDFF